jgi:hypothetical protein
LDEVILELRRLDAHDPASNEEEQIVSALVDRCPESVLAGLREFVNRVLDDNGAFQIPKE